MAFGLGLTGQAFRLTGAAGGAAGRGAPVEPQDVLLVNEDGLLLVLETGETIALEPEHAE